MKGTRHLGCLVILLALGFGFSPARALPRFSEYGPACQWIRLSGAVPRPPGLDPEAVVFLTVTYRLPGQRAAHTLMTNQPVRKEKFLFVLAGFEEKIDGVFFVDPGFFFANKIVFQYYAASADRKWKSQWQQSVYLPEWEKKEGNTLCRTGIALQTLALEAQ